MDREEWNDECCYVWILETVKYGMRSFTYYDF